jgi:hypothetical protein
LSVAVIQLHHRYCDESDGKASKGDERAHSHSPKGLRDGGDGGQRNGDSYRMFWRTEIKRSARESIENADDAHKHDLSHH